MFLDFCLVGLGFFTIQQPNKDILTLSQSFDPIVKQENEWKNPQVLKTTQKKIIKTYFYLGKYDKPVILGWDLTGTL